MKSIPWIRVAVIALSVFARPARALEENPPPDPGNDAKPAQEDDKAGNPGETPPEETPPPEDPAAPGDLNAGLPQSDPDFSKESSKTDFEKAKGLYKEGKFKEAEPIFKKVKADAKSKEDKLIVEVWAQGSKGAILLEKVKSRVKARQLLPALQEAEGYVRQFAGTPAERGFREVIKEVERQIYTVVESFDSPSAAYTEKFGKTYIKDPALELDGTLCLRWASTKERDNNALKVRNVPQDWTKFEALEFWVNVTAAPTDVEAVIGCVDASSAAKKKPKAAAPTGKKKKAADDQSTGAYVAPVTLPGITKRWQKVRIPIGEFHQQGDGALTNALYFQIQVAAGRNFDFMIDKIALLKKASAVSDPAVKGKAK